MGQIPSRRPPMAVNAAETRWGWRGTALKSPRPPPGPRHPRDVEQMTSGARSSVNGPPGIPPRDGALSSGDRARVGGPPRGWQVPAHQIRGAAVGSGLVGLRWDRPLPNPHAKPWARLVGGVNKEKERAPAPPVPPIPHQPQGSPGSHQDSPGSGLEFPTSPFGSCGLTDR